MAIAIEFNNISKIYRLGLVSTGTLAHDLKRWWTTSIRGKEDPYLTIGETNDRSTKGESEYVWALRDIDFKVEQGDVVGIIGKNGAGKSTLLKILSKVTAPTTGTIRARGRIGSLLEVGTGFHPEMTGRENIYLNGAILGMTKAEITKKLDEIVDFSGCERYIDTPVKRYSSGMMVRLGFAVAAHLDPEILVVDEVLAVGDAEFQKKAIGKMQDVSRGEGRTVLFVSHNMGSIAQLCTTGLLLTQGKISFTGEIHDCISQYISEGISTNIFVGENTNNDMFFQQVSIVDNDNHNNQNVAFDNDINILFHIGCNNFIPNATLSFTLFDYHQSPLFTSHFALCSNSLSVTAQIPSCLLLPGLYYIKPILHVPNVKMLDICDVFLPLTITDTGSDHTKYVENKNLGYFNMPILWKTNEKNF
ncbi:MAG: ABC transporter ATP-binding protein [Bacteroidales bacterium]|nr:ABC transporter ATP-binding protein [Bacteroidales bacterium]